MNHSLTCIALQYDRAIADSLKTNWTYLTIWTGPLAECVELNRVHSTVFIPDGEDGRTWHRSRQQSDAKQQLFDAAVRNQTQAQTSPHRGFSPPTADSVTRKKGYKGLSRQKRFML
ncbi:hypothetical protein N7501_003618 [Penicillium viridicatum]|nr:hypothetical protein N7501_003618 [Penicillium viridicatum]